MAYWANFVVISLSFEMNTVQQIVLALKTWENQPTLSVYRHFLNCIKRKSFRPQVQALTNDSNVLYSKAVSLEPENARRVWGKTMICASSLKMKNRGGLYMKRRKNSCFPV
jgi:hypothetical protein